jgi:enoyl-CoA hydratase
VIHEIPRSRVRILSLDGPGKNALSTPHMQSLLVQLGDAHGEPLLVTGAPGNAFSAGLDLREVASLGPDEMRIFLGLFQELLRVLWHYPGPTVAHVNGHAIAGGCLVSMCCDWRVAPPDARLKIGLNETAIGLRFPPELLHLARRRVSERHLTRVILGAVLFDPAGAQEVGLLDQIADDSEAAARAMLEQLGRLPPAAYAATKADLRALPRVTAEEQRQFATEVIPSWTSPELKQRILSVLRR